MQSDREKRAEGRSNVFLTAVLETDTASFPVRVRNISASGALVDGPVLPPVGAKVRLLRGSLTAAGVVAWQQADHAGLNFDASIDIGKWVQRTDHSGQQRVDGIVAAIRRAEPTSSQDQEPEELPLAALSIALSELCERLASNDKFPLELGEELIKLDAIAQSLRDLSAR